ncbi:uncharacterized protein JCM6883_002243 [Sporobolomyces salmoneus]|uniref:uncharacterized protein n=1 Tax=Sporobolomyces salmoneus TaxID=183962 RepID=UPI0031785C42
MTTSDWPAGIAGTVGNSDAKSFVKFAEAAEATEIVEILKSKQQEEEEERGAARDGSYDYDDSDIETDEATKALLHEPKNPSSASFITVRITQHTYETYLALLCWIGTGEIEFAPLRSTFQYPFASGPSAEPIPARAETLLEDIAVSLPRNPIPVSPKSIYRLAHFLELEGELSSLALSNFESQLTVENVMYELYTDVASKYHELRDVAIAFAIKHWSKVLKTRAYKDVLQRADDVGIDGATGLLLSERLSQAWKKGGK